MKFQNAISEVYMVYLNDVKSLITVETTNRQMHLIPAILIKK